MSPRDLQRYQTLQLVLTRRLTGAQAAAQLGLSHRQVWRLAARLRVEGRQALVHGNRGRPSPRRLPLATRQEILTLAQGPYAGLNTAQLTLRLQREVGLRVSRPTVVRLLRASGVARPRRHRQREPVGNLQRSDAIIEHLQ